VETPIVFTDRRVGQSKMSRAIFAEALLKVWALRFGRRGRGRP
jgi:dolichol-phosphate mannosyltransferase